MSTPTTVEPDVREETLILEQLDFDPELPCEFPWCEEKNPAEHIIAVVCPKCPREVRILSCDPCWKEIQSYPTIRCEECGHSRSTKIAVRWLGRLK